MDNIVGNGASLRSPGINQGTGSFRAQNNPFKGLTNDSYIKSSLSNENNIIDPLSFKQTGKSSISSGEEKKIQTPEQQDIPQFFTSRKSFKTGDTTITPVLRQDTVQGSIEMIKSARKTLDVNMFSLKAPKIKALLIDKAKSGVKIRILTDLSGETKKWRQENKELIKELKRAGVQVLSYPKMSFLNQFNHTKMVIADDKRAMIGSRNWGHTLGKDKDIDTAFFITGDTVDEARVLFEHDWELSGGTPRPASHTDLSPGVKILGNEPMNSKLTNEIKDSLKNAKKSIEISMAWFSDGSMLKTVKAAKERGVDVRILLANTSQNNKAYEYLKKAGVDVRIYSPEDKKSRSYFHQKTIIVDDEKVISGSNDLTPHGLYLNREMDLVAKDKGLAVFMKDEFNNDWENLSTPLPLYKPKTKENGKKHKSMANRFLKISEKLPGSIQKAGMKLASLISLAGRRFTKQDFS